MGKLRVKRNFTPAATAAGDELFRNGIFIFNISKIIAYIKEHPKKFQQELVSVKKLRLFEPSNLDEKTVASADLSSPLILAEISPGRMNLIDGHHRLEKAFQSGIDQLPAYRLLVEQHLMFLTSKDAYKEYVSYWNSKL